MLLAPEYMDIVISMTQKRQLILTRIQHQPLQPQIQRGEWHVWWVVFYIISKMVRKFCMRRTITLQRTLINNIPFYSVQLLLNLARALMQTIATLMGYASVVRQVQHVNLQMAHHTAYTIKM